MANKIYDFLPAHLRNSELESIFDATLERAFSKGDMQKEKAFLGRKEKGIYSDKDVYMSFPPHLYQRDNYGLEPVFSNTAIGDNIYYDDLLNSMFNKGMLVNDHRRLFKSKSFTVNLPIDADKFANWSLYYWVSPGFFIDGTQDSSYKHYVTVEKSAGNWWGENNAWYHYDDIRELITTDNKQFIEQAKRPIIEFDSSLTIANTVTNNEWVKPQFTADDGESYSVFEYVSGDVYPVDIELGFKPKMKAGDYNSEFVFRIDLPQGVEVDTPLYVECEFNYRNLRQEAGSGEMNRIELVQAAKSENDIDVYVDGIKQIGNYSYTDGVIEFDEIVDGYVYVDYCTADNVLVDGDAVWQRIDPAVEYNIDNEYHSLREMTYSTVYEHMIRLIETTAGLTGEANGVNNFRQIGDNADKTRFNHLGSVLVRNSIDIKKAYFAITRNDYDPIKATEFLSTAYNNFKNKLVSVTQSILSDAGSETKSTTEILEQAIRQISLAKRSSISVFDGSLMINFGENLSHYTVGEIEIVVGSRFQPLPDDMIANVVDSNRLSVYVNGELQKNITDYELQGSEIVFTEFTPVTGDTITIRYFEKIEETFIPPSSTKLGINELYVPRKITDIEYTPTTEMIVGHDGSLVPVWGDRTDDVLLEFETLIFNRLVETADTEIKHFNYGIYRDSGTEYSVAEKKYTQYPFFKKWMIRNNIDNLYNDTFDADNWKTWNYRSINELSPGNWRGIMQFVYGTDNPVAEPWVTVGYSQKPSGFDAHGTDYTQIAFWENLKTAYNKDWPVPVDGYGQIATMNDLFFGGAISVTDVVTMDQDWEFGDGSPVEMAWKRSSEFPFAEFLLMMLTKPFEVLDNYSEQVDTILSYYNAREGYTTSAITKEREQYEFKLGSKLGGFVNNFKLLAENSGLSNSRYTDIPKDNYDLFVHAGEPNRSESFSAIVIEKVSLDKAYPTYDMNATAAYVAGDIVYNPYDKKHYKRKTTGETAKETTNSIKFDYSVWTLISQPNTREFGYRVHGYDDYNPTFFAMSWDKTSKQRVWSTDGDPANLAVWTAGEYYKQDSYTMYNNKAYVSLKSHTASTQFDNDIQNWKMLTAWPRINTVDAYGYSETLLDQIQAYNYGDILKSVDEVAHLMIGYQAYLKAVGWDFTDIDEDNRVVDFERLLEKFLDWSAETHVPGDFITLTPILTSGSFDAPYGVSTVGRETNKNYYRVVDENGNQIRDTQITFNSDGSKITWESSVPVYGIKVDVADIEHAFVVDRVDSYGDVIYDPFSHNRNLRMIVDCNRTSNWDGTLAASGYLVHNNELVPNLDTMVAETRYYRDTLVDQSLQNVNNLKASQIGYAPRTYLANHGVERESQIEFYKGFLAGKATVSSINRIINFNSNFTDLEHKDIWAFKLADYGKLDNSLTASKVVNTIDIISDPHVVDFDIEKKIPYLSTGKRVAVKTAGYVDPVDVNYVVPDADTLETSTISYFEGDTAWVRFDNERDWDVKRLSEIAEINYVGETSDGQLKVALTNEIDISNTAYLKIVNSNIDPEIEGNYYFVKEAERVTNGVTVYEYLVFDQSYEPLIVEIDTTTDNSVYVPTGEAIGVEAVGYISNPTIVATDTLVIDGVAYTYTPGSGTTVGGITIGGTTATADPIVSPGEQVRVVVYDSNGLIANSNTLVTFSGTNVTATNNVISVAGDKIDINGTTLTIDYSATQSISAESTLATDDEITSGKTLRVQSNGDDDTVTFADIVLTGTTTNPTITETKTIRINGVSVDLVVPVTPGDVTETFSATASQTDFVITETLSASTYSVATVTVDGTPTTDFTVAGQTVTVNTPVMIGGESVAITLTHVAQVLDTQDIVDIINASGASVSASIVSNVIEITSSSASLTMTGNALLDIGMGSNSISESKLANLAADLNALTYLDAYISGDILVIETDNDEMTLSGTAFNDMGFPTNTYESNSEPTATSIVQQINVLNIPNVSATVQSGKVKIISNGSVLTIEENSATPGAMTRLGYVNTTETAESIDSIIADLNTALSDLTNTSATEFNRRVQITSDQATIVLSNVTGNAWNDMGIAEGTYSNTTTTSSSAVEFKDQINAATDDVTVSITSDGRMVFTSDATAMTFSGTAQAVLDRIGLYRDYTSVTSNSDFKVMRWKSVRFTPGYNGVDFDEFYTKLGLNSSSMLWVDDYQNYGWAVLERDAVGSLHIRSRQARAVDTDFVSRVVAKTGDNFTEYQLYDPINFKISGSIAKDIDYVDWNDPAKYDVAVNNDMWLSQRLGEIWWDTNSARYYRYDDFGDANGNIRVNYAKRFWGKLVPGSEIVVKQWVTSETLPEGVSQFNTETYYDAVRQATVTRYFYWDATGAEARYNKEFSVEEIAMMLQSPTTVNKFFPIDNDTIIISNNANVLTEDTIEYSIEYNTTSNRETHHSDWELVSRKSRVALEDVFLQDFKKSIAGSEIEHYAQFRVQASQITPTGTVFSYDWIGDNSLTKDDVVVSINNEIVSNDDFGINVNEITISVNVDVLEDDVICVYHVVSHSGWFKDLAGARSNFASSVHATLNRRMLITDFPMYSDYIAINHGIFGTSNWYYSDEYETIERFEYLSRTRDIDMITLHRNGVASFKIELPEYDEYYFAVNNEIRMVHRSNSVLALDFNTSLTTNQISVQLHELMNMIYEYAEVSEIKSIFFDMVEYMYTEKTYPEWIFKTSYIDLTMYNKPLRQYAIYQRDTYQDTIDYVMETKPYHTKIRTTERIYPVDELAEATVDALHHMTITKFFGEHSRFELNGIDGGNVTPTEWNDEDIDPDTLDPLADGDYLGGKFLRNDIEYTASADGFDTGPFKAQARDASVIKVATYTDATRTTLDRKEFYVYDKFGRGYHIPVKFTGTISTFDGTTLSVNQASKFKAAKDETVRLIAVENSSGNVEFMLYDFKSGNDLRISTRATYNGIAASFENGDTVYVLGAPDQIYSHEDA